MKKMLPGHVGRVGHVVDVAVQVVLVRDLGGHPDHHRAHQHGEERGVDLGDQQLVRLADHEQQHAVEADRGQQPRHDVREQRVGERVLIPAHPSPRAKKEEEEGEEEEEEKDCMQRSPWFEDCGHMRCGTRETVHMNEDE